MRYYVLIQDDIFEQVAESLPSETGEMVTVPMRDQVFEDVELIDDEGNPTGVFFRRFIGFGEPYEKEIPEMQGGFCSLGYRSDWHYLLLTSNNSTMVQLENEHEENFVTIMKWPDLDTFEDRSETRMATNIRSKLNDWRSGQPIEDVYLDPYPASILNGEALQDTLLIFNPIVDILQFSIISSKD